MNNNILLYIGIIIATVGAYYGAAMLVQKLRIKYLHPLIITTTVIIVGLKIFDIDYSTFRTATLPINWMLGPSVTALGWVMYNQLKAIRKNILSIVMCTAMGAAISILLVVGMAVMFGIPESIKLSIAPKSITTPIAIQIAEMIGGVEAITVTVVIVTAIVGAAIAPLIYRMFRIYDPVAQGLALGVAAHAIGTTKALEMGTVQGAVAGMAIGLVGIFSAILAPIIFAII